MVDITTSKKESEIYIAVARRFYEKALSRTGRAMKQYAKVSAMEDLDPAVVRRIYGWYVETYEALKRAQASYEFIQETYQKKFG